MRFCSSKIAEDVVATYCICKLADVELSMNVRMVMCDECYGYFDETCVNIADIVWEDKNIEYVCPDCKTDV